MKTIKDIENRSDKNYEAMWIDLNISIIDDIIEIRKSFKDWEHSGAIEYIMKKFNIKKEDIE